MDLEEIRPNLGEICPNIDEISTYLEEIRPNLDEISPNSLSSGQLSIDWIENGWFSFEFRLDLNKLNRKWAIFQSDTVRLVKYRFLSLKPTNQPIVFGFREQRPAVDLSPVSGQPVLGPDWTVWAGGSGSDFVWIPLLQIQKELAFLN